MFPKVAEFEGCRMPSSPTGTIFRLHDVKDYFKLYSMETVWRMILSMEILS